MKDRDAAELDKLALEMEATVEKCFAQCVKPQTAAQPPPPAPGIPPAAPPRVALGPPGAAPLFIVEPHIGFTMGRNTASGAYSSDGGQDPADGNARRAQQAFNAGVDLLIPLGVPGEPAGQLVAFLQAFGGFRIASGVIFQDEKVTIDVVRHGADGRVRVTEKELANIDLMVMAGATFSIRIRNPRAQRAQFAEGPSRASYAAALSPGIGYWPVTAYGGVGLSFVRSRITITSDKVPGGDVFTSTSETKWDKGPLLMFGLKTPVCSSCAFGNTVNLGLEWQGRWMPNRSVATTSPAFAFTETGRVSSRFSSQVVFKVSVPFTISFR